jgi:hypothetical protein
MRRHSPRRQKRPECLPAVIRTPHAATLRSRSTWSEAVRQGIGDKIQLQQVILNLVVNAIEAMSGIGDGPRELCLSSQKVAEIPGKAGNELEANALTEPESEFVLIAVHAPPTHDVAFKSKSARSVSGSGFLMRVAGNAVKKSSKVGQTKACNKCPPRT